MKTYVKGTGYKNNTPTGKAQIKAHLKYIETRPNDQGEREQREMFDENGPKSREDFQVVLDRQPKGGVNAHKIVISMERGDMKHGNIDMEELTKHAMAQLEEKLGRKLDWIAVKHDKKSNPHVHIVIAGHDKDGKPVKLTKREYAWLKNRVDMERKRQEHRNIERGIPTLKIPDLEHALARKANSMARSLQHAIGNSGHGSQGHGGGIGSIKSKILKDREENERD